MVSGSDQPAALATASLCLLACPPGVSSRPGSSLVKCLRSVLFFVLFAFFPDLRPPTSCQLSSSRSYRNDHVARLFFCSCPNRCREACFSFVFVYSTLFTSFFLLPVVVRLKHCFGAEFLLYLARECKPSRSFYVCVCTNTRSRVFVWPSSRVFWCVSPAVAVQGKRCCQSYRP